MWTWQSAGDLALNAVEQFALEFLHLAAAQAGHVHVVALGTPFVEMPFAFDMQQVQLVHQPLLLQKSERSIYGHAIDLGIDAHGLAQNLRGVEPLAGRLDDLQNDAALTRQADAAAEQPRRLERPVLRYEEMA